MIIKSIYCSDDRPYATLDAQKYIFNEAKVPIGGTFAYGCAPERWSSSNISTKIIWRKYMGAVCIPMDDYLLLHLPVPFMTFSKIS